MYMVWGQRMRRGRGTAPIFVFWFFGFLAFSSVALDTYIRFSWRGDGTAPRSWTYVQHAKFMGKRIDTHFVVTELVPGARVSIESTKSTFPIQVTRSVEPIGERRCRVTAHVRGQPTGLLKLFSGMVAKSVAKDYAKLRSTLEISAS